MHVSGFFHGTKKNVGTFSRCMMATKTNSADGRTRSSIQIFIVVGLCCFFYILGAWQRSGFGKGDSIAMQITKCEAECNMVLILNFKTHPGINNNSPV